MLRYSIAELLDKLCVTNLKLWHAEERIEILKGTKEIENLNLDKETLLEIDALLNQVVSLNELRLKILESIKEFFEERK